jgi:hypothetical protein
MQNYHDGNRPVSVAPQGSKPQGSKPQGSKTWDFMETTLVALLAYGAYLLVGGLALTVLMATQGGAALSPAGAEAIPRGLESAATIVGCAATVAVLWIAIRKARRDFSEYLALNWPTRDEAMADRRPVPDCAAGTFDKPSFLHWYRRAVDPVRGNLCRSADHGRVHRSRLHLSRLVRISCRSERNHRADCGNLGSMPHSI